LNTRLSNTTRRKIAGLYANRMMQVRTIAQRFGVAPSTVTKIASEYHLELRKPGKSIFACAPDTGGMCVHAIAYRGRLESVRQRFQGAW
jgi:hypothetical protein